MWRRQYRDQTHGQQFISGYWLLTRGRKIWDVISDKSLDETLNLKMEIYSLHKEASCERFLSCCSPASLTAFLISKLLMEQDLS